MRNKKITKRWLATEMDRRVKQMLKLIDEDADSFSKKAEMYYQKRPELVAHVEEFYRLYRTLAERNNYLSGELRRNVPSDLQSHGSGISDIGSELHSAWPSPDHRPSRPPRAAGFEFFLGSGWSSPDLCQREGDESPYVTDSEPESDDSSVNNYAVLSTNVGDHGMSRRAIELEIELREVKDKLRALEEDNKDYSLPRGAKNEYSDLLGRIGKYEEELKIANDKLRLSEGEINWLRAELQKYKQRETSESESSEEENVKMSKTEPEIDVNKASASELPNKIGLADEETVHDDGKIHPLGEEFSVAKETHRDPEKEIACLRLENKQAYEKIQDMQSQLDMAETEISRWKFKLKIEKKEVHKLQGRIAMLKDSLSSRDHEIRDLKIKAEEAELKIFPENTQIKAEISKLLEERNCLEEQIREWDSHAQSLEEEIKIAVNGKRESEERLRGEIEALKVEIDKRGDCIKILNENHEALQSERDELKTKIDFLEEEFSCKCNQIVEMDEQLQRLRTEHVELMDIAKGAHKSVKEMEARAKELEDEIERQRTAISEGAEEKREAIRQLCFSLEYYKNEHHKLLQAFTGHK